MATQPIGEGYRHGGRRPGVRRPYQGGQRRTGALGSAAGRPGARSGAQGRVGPPGGGSMRGRVPNGLLRTADDAVNRAGTRLGQLQKGAQPPVRPQTSGRRQGNHPGLRRMRSMRRQPRFAAKGGMIRQAYDAVKELDMAKGGAVRRLIKRANDWIHEMSEDPEFDTALAELKDAPGTEDLQDLIRGTQRLYENPDIDEETMQGAFIKLQNSFESALGQEKLRESVEEASQVVDKAIRGKTLDDDMMFDDLYEHAVDDIMLKFGIGEEPATELYDKIQRAARGEGPASID